MTDRPAGFAAYIAVTAAYWCFMLTDGALRMLVLLHFHVLGFSPVQLAYLFILYEVAGIVTNLGAGWIAARFGLTSTLYMGLALQIVALVALAQLDPVWGISASVIYAMCVQGLSGVAKDLTKMSSKSAVKVLAPDEGSTLFKWVAILTGAKNAIKGLGYLIGAGLLALFGFTSAIVVMTAVLIVVLSVISVQMPTGLPTGTKGTRFKQVFSTSSKVNWLSAARVFLFGARDVWFVVGIPVYFYMVLSDGTPEGNRIAFFTIGVFMAAWTILYGMIQANAPRILKTASANTMLCVTHSKRLLLALAMVPAGLALTVFVSPEPSIGLTGTVIAGLLAFGGLFALNSSVHSYLILAFTTGERVTMDVGFYYMANASGRLLGTLLSGVSYQLGGLPACLGTAAGMLLLGWMATVRLSKEVSA